MKLDEITDGRRALITKTRDAIVKKLYAIQDDWEYGRVEKLPKQPFWISMLWLSDNERPSKGAGAEIMISFNQELTKPYQNTAKRQVKAAIDEFEGSIIPEVEFKELPNSFKIWIT